MKALLQEFWVNPVKKRWFIIGNLVLFGLFYLAYYFLDKHINPWLSLGLVLLALIFELIAIAFLAPAQLKEMWQDILSMIRWANRDALYYHYQNKHKDKDYKGPDWNDEEFEKIENLEKRVDAFVKASIDFQKTDFEKWKKRNIGKSLDHSSETQFRISLVILAAVCSFLILCISGWLRFLDTDVLITSNINNKAFYTIPAALIGTIIATPIIFVIWYFRDKNSRIQIENSRKDTNLKDFQKLSEWASGFHLPEIKNITSNKKTIKSKAEHEKPDEVSNECITSLEDSQPPESSHSISRRQGAEALQASAIAQLEAFMFGKYGEQFMQPAFLLIHAIWESLITQQREKYIEPETFQKSMGQLYMNPIVSALNKALAGEGGYHLRLFKENLKELNLIGLSSDSQKTKPLNLSECNLSRINLSFSVLIKANLISAKLFSANLEHTCLIGSSLQNANLENANLKNSQLSRSNIQGASLIGAKLQNSILSEIKAEKSMLQVAKLQGSILINARLQCADLTGAYLSNANFTDAQINRETLFGKFDFINHIIIKQDEIREDVLSRGAIWDDDPEWLVGKIQDAALLEKIRQDCADRAKQKGA